MYRDVHDALASHATDFEVRRELHAVPPHRVHEVTFDGTRAVCKLARGPGADPACEARVLQHVRAETSVPVPRVLAVGPDHFVAAWRDDLPDDPTADGSWARAAGAGMATLHAGTAFERTGLFRADDGLALDGHPTWSGTVRALLADRRDYLAEWGYAGVADEAVAFVREHRDRFDHDPEPVLVHGNVLPDHVGVADGEVTCVVDFEHALAAPGEYDYWRTAIPVFGGADPDPALRRAFRAGYESVRPLPEGVERRADCYRLVNAVSYLQALHVQRDPTDDAVRATADRLAAHARDLLADLRAGD